jgi:formylglycine-generating enzyme required for sulfatase activity
MQEIGRRRPEHQDAIRERIAGLIRGLIRRGRVRDLEAGDVEQHFARVPGRESEPLWVRVPPAESGAGPFSFWMGTHPDDWKHGRYGDEGPAFVTILSAFWMAATTVTLGQYRSMVPAHCHHWGEDRAVPVTEVSWFEAVLFAAWLNQQRARADLRAAWCAALATVPADFEFRLPTEGPLKNNRAVRGAPPTSWRLGDGDGFAAIRAF